MIGIIYATEREALPFLKISGALLIGRYPFLLFKPLKVGIVPCCVVISGIGKVSAAAATVELIVKHKAQFIVNVGICGALREDSPLSLGELYKISTAIEGDRSLSSQKIVKERFKCNNFFNTLEEATLVTTDKSVFDDKLRYDMSFIADLVDMEGAAIVRVANMYSVGCDIVKGVTDLANSEGVKTMKSNLIEVSLAISKVLLHAISR